MKNKIVGILILGIALVMAFIIFLFNRALTSIVSTSCAHGPTCPMWGTIDFQTNIGIGVMIFVVAIGLYLIFFGKEEKIVTKIKEVKQKQEEKKLTEKDYSKAMAGMNEEERVVFKSIIESQGTIFQSELVEKTNLTKVKVTRILDKLEGRGLVERKRRGMTNIVILNHKNH